MKFWKITIAAMAFVLLAIPGAPPAEAQSIASGTVDGTVVDPSGAAVTGATVEIRNPITGYQQSTTTNAMGVFRLSNIPFNNYHVEVTQEGFAVAGQDVNVRSTVPTAVSVALTLAGLTEKVTVEATGADIVETAVFAHTDVDISTLRRLPVASPGSGLSDAITLSSPGVVADSNGFFHPLGDHAQTSFSIDGQPISDQQSKAFSTQIPVNAVQSMEITTGTPNAEFGDKTSLVVSAVTRSGLGVHPTGSVTANYGSFGTPSVEADFAVGGQKAGWFTAFNGLRSGRFLDSPELSPIHDRGNNQNTFNRFDFRPGANDALHVNFFLARNSFEQPNTLDQPTQDQHQKVTTFNFAPGYQHTFGSKSLLTINPFVRQDRVNYYPSPDPADDTPATLSQTRHLTNWGVRGDVSYASHHHIVKIGGQFMETRLTENFSTGITDYAFNPVCLSTTGDPLALPSVKDPAQCAGLGFAANPDHNPDLLPMDLTRGGAPFEFASKGTVKEYTAYAQDSITLGKLTLSPGLRIDHYDGVGITDTQVEPRVGISYLLGPSSTVFRAGYARTMETPYNENLLVAASPDASPLIAAFSEEGGAPVSTGHRNQYNVGLQQALSRYVQIDAEYFWKFTENAYDFGVLFSTPVAFPISWPKSKLEGVSIRVSTTNLKGFQWYTTMGHNKARFFTSDGGVFRIDHDQNFQQTTNTRYQRKNHGPWVSFTWRYDSGLVAGDVASIDDAMALTPNEQAAIGFNGETATRIKIPAEGTASDDHNPPRIAPRHLLDLGFGTDNLFKTDRTRMTLRAGIANLTNKIALYNFHSTFSGTHFVVPRTYTASIGIVF